MQSISVKKTRQEHCTCRQDELPDLLSSLVNPTSQEYKNFQSCFWGHGFELCWFRCKRCERCKAEGHRQTQTLSGLPLLSQKTSLLNAYLVVQWQRGTKALLVRSHISNSTLKPEACYAVMCMQKIPSLARSCYILPQLQLSEWFKVELMWSDCDVASPGDNCPADETQCQHLKAMAAVWWAVGRNKESRLLSAVQPSRNKKSSSFAWRELQLQLQTPLSYKADLLYPRLPRTSQHPMYHSWIKLWLVSLFWPPSSSLCLCLAAAAELGTAGSTWRQCWAMQREKWEGKGGEAVAARVCFTMAHCTSKLPLTGMPSAPLAKEGCDN